MPREARIEIRRGRTGLYRFVLIAVNGEPLTTSQHYASKGSCRKGIDAMIGCFNGHHGDPIVVDTTVK